MTADTSPIARNRDANTAVDRDIGATLRGAVAPALSSSVVTVLVPAELFYRAAARARDEGCTVAEIITAWATRGAGVPIYDQHGNLRAFTNP